MKLYKDFLTKLGQNDKLKKITPIWIRSYFRERSNLYAYNLENWKLRNKFIGSTQEYEYEGNKKITIGIIYDFSHRHVNYMEACQELGVSYKVINLFSDNWLDQIISNTNIEMYVVWPSTYSNVWKTVLDERLSYLVNCFDKTVFPSNLSTWLYESKRRLNDWFKIHNIKTPKTYVFYDYSEAINFAENTSFPTVFKSDLGAGATGVLILKNKEQVITQIDKLFFDTFVPKRLDSRETQWGYIMFQDYIEGVEEWRVARIGDSYFVRLKQKVGEFHSGTGAVEWATPREEILDLAREVTEIGSFKSMGVDIFESPSGELFVNEIHTVFGVKDLGNDKDEGKWLYENEEWTFYPGNYSKYQFAKERIKFLIKDL